MTLKTGRQKMRVLRLSSIKYISINLGACREQNNSYLLLIHNKIHILFTQDFFLPKYFNILLSLNYKERERDRERHIEREREIEGERE